MGKAAKVAARYKASPARRDLATGSVCRTPHDLGHELGVVRIDLFHGDVIQAAKCC